MRNKFYRIDIDTIDAVEHKQDVVITQLEYNDWKQEIADNTANYGIPSKQNIWLTNGSRDVLAYVEGKNKTNAIWKLIWLVGMRDYSREYKYTLKLPPSKCLACNAPIEWETSYIFLGEHNGQCTGCKKGYVI